jgi:hypothetical protein
MSADSVLTNAIAIIIVMVIIKQKFQLPKDFQKVVLQEGASFDASLQLELC